MELISAPLSRLLFIDIETVPASPSYEKLPELTQELWEGKRGKYRPEDTDKADYYFNNAAIFAEFGKIVCISMGYFSEQDGRRTFRVKSIAKDEESELLRDFVQVLNKFDSTFGNQLMICGHNVKEFDVPYICRRLIVNELIEEFPAVFRKIQYAKPWELNALLLDTLDTWRFGDYKNYISLKLYTHILGIASPKDDIDGSEVGRVYYLENNLERIRIYCEKDVIAVASIILKLKNLPMIREEEVVYL